MAVRIKRIYEAAAPADGVRVLVDRLWPRGIKKSAARLDDWMKDVAPSPQLRIWFGHKPERFEEFASRYKKELLSNPALGELRKLAKGKLVTLLYAARDPEVNHAQVLQSVLRSRLSTSRRTARKDVPL
jgi:uncharacterized protein YeaO (DUF488 family)